MLLCLLILSIWFRFSTTVAQSPTSPKIGDPLIQPPSVTSSNGELDVYLKIEYAFYQSPVHSVMNARLLNGTSPGPTFYLSPGDTLKIEFHNDLRFQPNAVQNGQINSYKKPDNSNLHWHGLHASGELPSDDIRLHVRPGQRYNYKTKLPDDHMGGTHWQHAHSHGSTMLQVSSGASSAIIVKDPPGYLPSDIENAEEVLLLVHYWFLPFTENVRNQMRDDLLKFGPGTQTTKTIFRTVNGQYQPKHTVKQNEWQRWRIVYSNWARQELDLKFDSCEMYLLAKDGVYINDYPRRIFIAPIPTAGRADIMVRCQEVGTFEVRDYAAVLMTVEVTSSDIEAISLQPWTPTFPSYLESMLDAPPDKGCSCSTQIGNNAVNGIKYNPFVYIHTAKYGANMERDLINIGAHPFHMHVYPFQIKGQRLETGGIANNLNAGTNSMQRNYFRVGDWHDVLLIRDISLPVVTRFKVDTFDGRIFIHCHRLEHEDLGMMAQELVIVDGECGCDILLNRTGDLAMIKPGTSDKEIVAMLAEP